MKMRLSIRERFGIDTVSLVFILVCSVLLGIIHYFALPNGDDYNYGRASYLGFSLEGYKDFFVNHFTTVNGRFGDKLVPLFCLLPRWAYSLLMIVVYCVIFGYSAKLSLKGNENNRSLYSILLVSLLIMLLPWYDSMFSVSFSVNYMWPMAMSLVVVDYFINQRPERVGFREVLMVFLTVVASAWHELYSVSIGMGLIVYWLMHRKEMTKVHGYIISGGFLGALFIVFAPGFWHRYDLVKEVVGDSVDFLGYIIGTAKLHILVYMFLFLLCMSFLWFVVSGKLRERVKGWKYDIDLLTFVVVEIISFVVIVKCSTIALRMIIIAYLFSTIGFIRLLVMLRLRIWRWLENVAKYAIAFGVVAHLVLSVYWQRKIFLQHEDMLCEYQKSDDGLIYFDLLMFKDIPYLCFHKPYSWEIQYCLGYIDAYYGSGNEEKRFRVVPECFRDMKISEAEVVNERQGVYKYNGYFFREAKNAGVSENAYTGTFEANVTCGNGVSRFAWGGFQRFEKEGRKFDYLSFVFYSRAEYLMPISEVEILK